MSLYLPLGLILLGIILAIAVNVILGIIVIVIGLGLLVVPRLRGGASGRPV